ncbi:TonB-dependent receptor [Edaphobacter paludis]|uniref:TonB-dependent receptor n=1 Tax=Edaphobacter paludis TaxID=3035702 RepID=A0AAU7CVP6_9BACT
MNKMRVSLALLAVCLLTLAPISFGQAVYGSIYGTITDASGAVVPNAAVTVTDVAKGTSTTVQSNGSGEFTAEHLIPDVYDVKIEAGGFKGFQQKGIQLYADTSTKVQAVLAVGGSDQTVEVNADSVPLLKTDRADVSTTFAAKEIVDLPIPDRNFTNLQLLLPGAQLLGWNHAADENPQGSKQIEVDGQAFAGVAFQLDGTDNQDPILGIIVVNPNADSLSETKITTQNFDAEFGKAVSSVVTAQTKSGSNTWHGSAFDYRESNANLARDPFTQGPAQLSAVNPFPQGLKNQFGGSLGGKIITDKLFFFGDYQGVRQKVGIANVQTVPTAHLVSTCLGQATTTTGTAGCDFSDYTPAVGQLYHQVNGQSVPYAGNVIPTSDLSAPAINFLKLLQPYAPNTAGSAVNGVSGLKNNYAGSGTGGFNSNQWDVRIDWTANDRVHAFGRFSRFTDTLTGKTMFGPAGGAGFGLGGYGGTSQGANDSAAAGADIVVSPKLVTDVRLGYFRYNIGTSKYDAGTNLATQLGAPGLNMGDKTTSGSPSFQLTEVGSFGGPNNSQATGPQYGAGLNVDRCNCPLTEREDQYQLVNNWTRVIGNHSVKFGADLRYARNLRVPSDNDRTGLLLFGTGPTSNGNNGTTGLGFASFVTGNVTQFQRYVSTTTNAKEFQKRDFFYVQDTWRASPKLTLNLGLRYELYFPETVNGKGNGALLNMATGYLQVAGYGNIGSNMNYHLPNNTYNPRIGVAYQVTPNTVIRAGYGRSFDIGVFGSIFGHAATQNLPVLQNQAITASGTDSAFNLSVGPPAATPIPVPASGLLPNPGSQVSSRARPTTLRLPTLDAWNASLQQSLTPTLSVTIAYVGNKGTHTFGDSSGNTTNPNEAAIALSPSQSFNGQALHWDPNLPDIGGVSQYVNGVGPGGAVNNQNLLRRYYGGSLPACNGPCGWTNDIQDFSDNLDTHYNALQVTMAKQYTHGISLNANYAWQQAISDATGYSSWDKHIVAGRDSALRQQQIIVYGLLELPFGRKRQFLAHTNRVVDQIVSGIQISPVINFSSGLPFTLSYSTCSQEVPGSAPCRVNGDTRGFHPNVTGIPGNSLSFYPAQNIDNGGMFRRPALDQIGNVGRNTVFGPHFFNADLSIQKNFTIREKYTFQLRADGFNAFNHINWGTPNGNIDQGGSISSGPFPGGSANPRQLQFSGRVQF